MSDNNGTKFMTAQEVAGELRVTLTTIYRWLESGTLRGIKLGDVWRIRRDDYEAFTKSSESIKAE